MPDQIDCFRRILSYRTSEEPEATAIDHRRRKYRRRCESSALEHLTPRNQDLLSHLLFVLYVPFCG
jgi:hypothetical protein